MSDSQSERNVIDVLAEEFLERFRRGEHPALAEFTERHPELADEIRDLFPMLLEIEGIRSDGTSVSEGVGITQGDALPPLKELGDYRIIREVGRGGMGIVYEAEQISLGRRVALKVLPRQMLLQKKHQQRFEREARAAAGLHHTNIVPVFGVGREEGYHYYVMQFIPGLGLDEVIDELQQMNAGDTDGSHSSPAGSLKISRRTDVSAANVARSMVTGEFERTFVAASDGDLAETRVHVSGPGFHAAAKQRHALQDTSASSGTFSLNNEGSTDSSRARAQLAYWKSVAQIGSQVADALQYAHGRGILHRDIKPSNLLLDQSGTVWVTDFGLAKASDQQDLTQTGDLLGTLRYMPPETFEGKGGVRGDVYSLGLTLYELLALRPAFDEKDRHKLIKQITAEEPPRLDKINPRIPRDLVTIVHKAIERDPVHRYATSEALGEDLERFLDDKPIRARRSNSCDRVRKWARRNPALATATSAVAVLLLTVAVISTVAYKKTAAALVRAEQNAQKAARNEKLANKNAAAAEQNAVVAQAAERRATQSAERAAANEALAKQHAHEAQQNAEREKLQRQATERQLYISQMYAAAKAWAENNAGRTVEILEAQVPKQPDDADYRGWEWQYLWRLTHSEKLKVKTEAIVLAYHPPQGTLVTGDWSGRITQWTADGKRQLWSVQDAGRCVRICFSRDGTLLATSHTEGAKVVRLRDANTGNVLRSFEVQIDGEARKYGMALSPDGKLIAISGNLTQIFSTADGKLVATIEGDNDHVSARMFTADGTQLVCCCNLAELKVQVFDAGTGAFLRGFASEEAQTAALSPDDHYLVTGNNHGELKLWDFQSGEELMTFREHQDAITSLDFSADVQRFVSGSNDSTVRIWSVDERKLIQTIRGNTSAIADVAFSPDGKTIATACWDHFHRLWDAASNQEPGIALQPNGKDASDEYTWRQQGKTHHLAYSRDGRFLVSCTTHSLVVRDASNHEKLWETDDLAEAAEFDARSQSVALGLNDGRVIIRAAEDGAFLREWKAQSGSVDSLDFSPDGTLLVTCGKGQDINLWNVVDARRLLTFEDSSGKKWPARIVRFHPQGKWIVTANEEGDNSAFLWDVSTGRLVRTFQHEGRVTAIAPSPDGKVLLTGCVDENIQWWDIESGKSLRVRRGAASTIYGLAISQDGRRMASCSDDGGFITVWDMELGQELVNLPTPTRRFDSVAFSPDITCLAAGALDDFLFVWDARPLTPELRDELVAAFEKRETSRRDRNLLSELQEQKRLVEQNPVDPECRFHLGCLLREAGQYYDRRQLRAEAVENLRAAIETFRQLLKKHPQSQPAATAREMYTAVQRLLEMQKETISAEEKQALLSDVVTAYVSAHAGAIEGGNVPYDVVGVDAAHDELLALRLELGDFSGALEVAGTAMSLVDARIAAFPHEQMHRRRKADLSQQIARKMPKLAIELLKQQKPDRASELLTLLDRFYHTIEEGNPNLLNEASWFVARERYQPDDAYAYALKWAARANGLQPNNRAVLNTLGVAQYRAGQFAEAMQTLTQSDALNSQQLRTSIPADVAFLAMALHQLDQTDEAQQQLDRLHAAMEIKRWQQDPESRAFLDEADQVLVSMPVVDQEFDGKLQELEQVLAGLSAEDYKTSAQRADLLFDIGNLLLRKQDFQMARQRLQEALEIRRKNAGDDQLPVADCLHALVLVCRCQNDQPGREQLARDAVAFFQKSGDQQTWQTLHVLYDLTTTLLQQGQRAAAIPFLELELRLRRQQYGARVPIVANNLRRFGEVLLAEGDVAGAPRMLNEAVDILNYAGPAQGQGASATEFSTLDLQPYANESLTNPEGMGVKHPGNDLAELPRGNQAFCGIPFQIGEKLIHLGSTKLTTMPRQVKDIAVGGCARSLHFLHSAQMAWRWERIGAYVVEYADGASETIPIKVGRDLRDWWHFLNPDTVPRDAAWVGKSGATNCIYLSKTSWTNPHPEREIKSITFQSANTHAAPFCVAITVERPADAPQGEAKPPEKTDVADK